MYAASGNLVPRSTPFPLNKNQIGPYEVIGTLNMYSSSGRARLVFNVQIFATTRGLLVVRVALLDPISLAEHPGYFIIMAAGATQKRKLQNSVWSRNTQRSCIVLEEICSERVIYTRQKKNTALFVAILVAEIDCQAVIHRGTASLHLQRRGAAYVSQTSDIMTTCKLTCRLQL